MFLFFKRTIEKRIKQTKIINLENKFVRSINDSEIKKFFEINNNNILMNNEIYEKNKILIFQLLY